MFTWRIHMLIHGKNEKMEQFLVAAPTFSEAKKNTVQEIRKLLPHKKNLFLEALDKGRYTVVSNFDDVGIVKIEQVSENN